MATIIRNIIVCFFLLCCSLSFAQSWICTELETYISYLNKTKTDNKDWAKILTKAFPLNKDNQIELNFVIHCSDSIPRNEIVALTEGWLGVVFTNPKNLIQESNENLIICVGDLGQVAFEQKFIGATMVKAPLEITVRYKDNRVRLTLLTRNYRMGHANVGTIDSGTVDIGSTFPFNNGSKYKSTYAMAYINTISKFLNLANGYLYYLNQHSINTQDDIPEW